jgi:hypothetical protein
MQVYGGKNGRRATAYKDPEACICRVGGGANAHKLYPSSSFVSNRSLTILIDFVPNSLMWASTLKETDIWI